METENRWTACKKCGSYIPEGWNRCGRCGFPVHARRTRKSFGKLLLLCIVAFGLYHYKDKLVSLYHEAVPYVKSQIEGFNLNETEVPVTVKQNRSVEETPATQDELYKKIENALKSTAESMKIPAKNEKDTDKVFNLIQNITLNDPEILFYESCSLRSDGLLTFKYSKPKDFIQKATKDMNEKIDQIVKAVMKPGMSEFDKELALHDYLVNHCRYDIENYKKDTIPPESHSAYGALLDGKAVCEGYAKALKLLLDKVGITSHVVSGYSKGQSHAWNIVRIDGAYYQLDATWDDPVMENGEQTLQHAYFNLTDKEMAADHEWTQKDYPACTSTAYNYYYHLNQVVSSPKAFISYLSRGYKAGKKHLSV
ncbi:MAG: hypothetical protein N2376_04715, partial [Clostridia bacterium]|nr:hypothetical protein [Clostridia bacterium]